MRLFSFSLAIAAFAVVAHLYLYRHLVRTLALNAAWRRALGALFVTMTLLLAVRRPVRDLGTDIEHAHAVVTYSWVAVALFLFIAVIADNLVGLIAHVSRHIAAALRRTPADPEVDIGRRAFVARTLHLGVLAGGGLTAAYGAFRAFAPPEVSEITVRLPGLPKYLEGLRIVQLSDVHVGPFIDRAFLDELVDQTNLERPDLVAITGDLVDGDVPALGGAIASLGRLQSRYGTFFVTGNHEYYSGVDPWCAFLEKLGVTVLRNRRVTIGDRGGSFDLVGVDDWGGRRRRGGGYDLDAALAGRDLGRAAILLSHQPVNFDAAAEHVGLQLSGHTHGGQLFPMTLFAEMRWKYSRGLYRRGDSHIYVSRGCGFWGPPARIGAPPEIVKIHLTA